MENVPDLNTILTVGGITAPVVWGIIEVSKRSMDDKERADKDFNEPWWWNTIMRALAMFVGGIVGTSLYDVIVHQNGYPWGTMIGIGSGALATSIVAVVKRRLKVM